MAITAHKLRRAEIWSTWAAAGGVRQAVVDDATILTATSNITGSDQLNLALPLVSPALPFVVPSAVIRVEESDGVFDEWRIEDGPNDDDGSGLRSVQGLPIRAAMATCELVRRIDSDGTSLLDFESVGLTPAQQIAAWVIPALTRGGMAWVVAGTITPTKLLDLTFSNDTPLSILQRIADQTEMELDIRRTGGGYAIDIIPEIGSTQPIADLRFDKNLQPGTKRNRSGLESATRVYPFGASEDDRHATMARATWLVTNIAGLVVTLADPAGGAGPIQFDGQLAGLNGTTAAYLRKPGGTLTAVSASSALNQTVTVASVASLAVNDLVQFRADSGGSDMLWLDSPADHLLYNGPKVGTVEMSDVPSTNNLLKNAAMRAWPGSPSLPPLNWTQRGGGTIARQAASPFTRVGGFSIHRVGVADGDGVISDAVPIFPTALKPYVSGYAGLWVVSGQVRVELVFTTGGGPVVQPLPPDFATNSILGQWEDLGAAGIDANVLGATTVALRVVQHGATVADFYLDYGQVTDSPSQLPLVESSGGTRLWQAANEKLRTGGAPLVSYELNIVDLANIDPVTWGDDCKVVVGGRVRVTDPRLSIAIMTRIIELKRDYKVWGDSKLTLSNKPGDLTGADARPPSAPRSGVTTGDASTAADEQTSLNNFRVVAETTTQLTYGWDAGSLVSEVWLGSVLFTHPVPADPWAIVAAAVAPLPAGTTTLVINKPAEGSIQLLQVEPRLADLTVGRVQRVAVNAAPTQPPIIELDDIETGTVGTQWWKITERGIGVAAVEVQTQIGIEPISAWVAPTRSAGGASAVRGGTLGAGEFEHDVTLDPTRTSWIMPRVTLGNGAPPIVLGPFGFDRDKNPNLLLVTLAGTILTIIADSDTKSIRVLDKLGTWQYEVDNVSAVVDVSKTGTNGVAGLGASASSTFTVEARSDPSAYVTGGTLKDSRDVVINGSTAPPPSALLDTLQAIAPSFGSDQMTIKLKATGAPALWTVKLYSGLTPPFPDITASVSPALSVPPTVLTSYTWHSGYTSISSPPRTQRTFVVRADLLDNTGVVVDSRTTFVSWYSSP